MVFSRRSLSKSKAQRVLLVSLSLVFLGLLCACNQAGAQQADTAPAIFATQGQNSPTPASLSETQQTSQATQTATPSFTPTAPFPSTVTVPTSTTSPAVKATGLPPTVAPQSLLVLDPIQIRAPAAGSQVVSPLKLEINFQLDVSDSLIRIELRRPDGALLARKLLNGNRLASPGELLIDQIEFDIAEPSSRTLLIVAVEHKRQTEKQPGLILAVNSSELIISNGPAHLMPPTWQAKTIDIQQPAAEASISGGAVAVSGLTRLDAADTLKVQLLDQNGKLISQRLAGISDSPQGEYNLFSTELTYQIRQLTPAWVVVYRDNPQAGVVIHLASQPVLLKP